jgi:two-component sensor histidine kinase
MYDRNQYKLAIAGLIMTLVGLAALFLVPLAVGNRLQREFGRVDQLERSRLAIGDAIEIARQSDTFLMHRYVVPGDTRGQYIVEPEYNKLLSDWRAAVSKTDIEKPLDAKGQADWSDGKAIVSRWIEQYLVRYTGSGASGGAAVFEEEEKRFRRGLVALASARSEATQQQDALRRRLEWLNTAQLTVVTPMAIICFALAFLAWTNVRTLQQTWAREAVVSGELEVAVKESNHRIKNNLQVIGALIDMKLQEPGAMVPKSALEDIVHQVRAVAAVHDFFSHELRSDQIQGDQMLRRLVDLTALPIGLNVQIETETIALAVKQATALALITNELLLNSGKHGATEARIVMKVTGSVARLRVSDNGPGFPPDFDAVHDANLGLSLVDTLARHDLQGHILFANDSGARVEVTFPLIIAA